MAYLESGSTQYLYNSSGGTIEIQNNGSLKSNETASLWDDLRVFPNSLPLIGANSPQHTIIANDGVITSGNSMSFDGSNDNGTVAYFAGMDTNELTIAMWTKGDTITQNELLDRDVAGGFELYMNGGNLVFAPIGTSTVSSSGGLIVGAKQFLVVTIKEEGTNLRCKLYIDGNNVAEQVLGGPLYQGSGGGYIFGEWRSGGWNYDGIMDNVQVYNLYLSDSQIAELYNSGDGTNILPTGIVASTDLIAFFKDNLVNQTTMAGATDLVQNGFTFVDGLIGSTSFGITALEFPAGKKTEIFFTAQLPHKYKEGTNIYPHLHWMYSDPQDATVQWGLEYMWVNPEAAVSGNTTIVTTGLITTIGGIGTHWATDIAELNGAGKTISSILQCRLFRQGDSTGDTYTSSVYLGDADFHYMSNTMGSRQIWIK